MKKRMIIKNIISISGILFFLCIAFPVHALDTPREILIEADRIINLIGENENTRTGLPDIDAFLNSHPDAVTTYALQKPINRHSNLNRFLLIRLGEVDRTRLHTAINELAKLSSVHWAQPNRLLQKLEAIPNDSLYAEQWGLQRIHAASAWVTTQGASTIPIAIIDTGCDMLHRDLIPSFWFNESERDGIPGIDDDGNGFIDDSLGWDFVDAPTFPTSGDYLDRDNDPSDEMGHGTYVAGICGAATDNGIGVAGTAPACPLMILRAGNLNGFLQEDDVASAILYALDNGARIVNMSFGDTQVSPMLEDVINYASGNGLLLVAAAGNSGNAGIIYPAAFSQTLCVGACDQNDQRASFSSYGTSLDLIAPGMNIVSTIQGQTYGLFQLGNGTSYAAPFASAVAGLVLSMHPNWTPTQVCSALKSSAEDIGTPGWDAETGHGILRADIAVQITEALVAEISSPTMAQGFAQATVLDIIGTAAGVYLLEYQIFTGIGENPSSWNLIQSATRTQVVNEVLTTWMNTQPYDTAYTIRLEVEDIFGSQVSDRVVIYVDPSAPNISNITLVPILDADRPSHLLSFKTDDLTTGTVWLHDINGSSELWFPHALGYQTTEHITLLGEDLPPKVYEYAISVVNNSGLTDSIPTIGLIDLQTGSIANNNFVELPPNQLPLSYFYEIATDLDGDSYLEIWVDTLAVDGSKSNLRVYEATGSWGFADLGLDTAAGLLDFGMQIPKSVGDSDADGKIELLTLYGGKSWIYEADEDHVFPQPANVIWSDTDSLNTWGAKLMDLDSTDGHGEVLLHKNGYYILYENHGDDQLTNGIFLPNPFNPFPTTLPPYCRANDYDGDGLPELLFGDYDGNLYIYERITNETYNNTWMTSLPLLDTGEFLTDGDFDGDGNLEFVVLAHTQTTIAGEHLADTRYWALYIFENIADNQYSIFDTLYFFGAENPSTFASGISSGDVYADPYPEILLCLFPDFYVVDWNAALGGYKVVYYYPQCQSNKAVVGDFNGNGHQDILFNTGSDVKVFEEVGSWSYWPPPPLNFSAIVEDTTKLTLRWSTVPGADAYNLYKNDFQTLFRTIIPPDTSYIDYAVQSDSVYYYAVSTFDFGHPEGPMTVPVMAIPSPRPYVPGDTAHFVPPNFVTVQFSEPIGPSLLTTNNYYITGDFIHPNSAVSDAGGSRVVLTFNYAFKDSTYRLSIYGLYDLQGSALAPPNEYEFIATAVEENLPYLQSAIPLPNFTSVRLVFSEDMNPNELAVKTNYTIIPDANQGFPSPDPIIILSATPDSTMRDIVTLQISPETPIGSLGKIYRVTARNVHSLTGLPIDTTHNTVTVNMSRSSLARTFVYPNPYKSGMRIDGEECVVFANLTEDVEIRILTVEGILIKTLNATNNVSGGLRWYLDNSYGEKVGSGIYLFYASSEGSNTWGKLAVIR